jgi:hypothetical protein
MVDVHCAQRQSAKISAESGRRAQQRCGISAAAQCHHQPADFGRNVGVEDRVQECRGKTHR